MTGPAGREAGLEGGRQRLTEAGEGDHSPLVQVLNGADPVLPQQADPAAPPASPLAAVHGAPSDPGAGRPSAAEVLPPGSTLLLYTDGLIEVPGSDLDTGLARLRRHALALAHEPLDTLCDRLPARMPPGSTDDVDLLALRLPSP
ncbi:SpoIIE family protein phosphatase [Streptomyces djakartensis]|uniref:SpoIIE family protein phosphatase n=1 Tax=Streptomyces djakartensis TaxID=68193 RepID=UPI0034DF5E44